MTDLNEPPSTSASPAPLTPRFNRSEAGEGVISAAIAVLIMAFLGAAMYLTYSRVLTSAGKKTDAQVCQIGNDPASGPPPTTC